MKQTLILLFLLSCNTFSQLFIDDVEHFFITGGEVFRAPLSWDTKDYINLGGTVLIPAAAFFVDDNVRAFSQRNISVNDGLFAVDKDPYMFAALSLVPGFYFYGLAFEDKDVRMLGLNLASAVAYSTAINVVIKSIAGRSRPYVEKGNTDFHPFKVDFSFTSLPSSHATISFAFCTVMANYSEDVYWRIGWYSAASLVSMARIYHDKHWLSDVLLGAAIGHFTADFITGDKGKDSGLRMGLLPNGVSFTYKF